MKPVTTNTTNTTFVADGCFDLPGTRYKYDDGTPGVETCWELSDEEVQEIVQNKKIFVYMAGHTVPPMFVAVKSTIEVKGKDDDHESEK